MAAYMGKCEKKINVFVRVIVMVLSSEKVE